MTLQSTELTPAACKKVVAEWLAHRQISYERLTARTIDFTDLARARCVFVQIHGAAPNPLFAELTQLVREHHFRFELR